MQIIAIQDEEDFLSVHLSISCGLPGEAGLHDITPEIYCVRASGVQERIQNYPRTSRMSIPSIGMSAVMLQDRSKLVVDLEVATFNLVVQVAK